MEKVFTARALKRNMTAWLLLLPSFIFLFGFTFYPVMTTVYDSFFMKSLGVPVPYYVGLDQYAGLGEDDVFRKVMGNTFIFVIVTVPVSMVLALAMALFVNKLLRGAGWIRTFYFYPTVIPAIAIANIWLYIYTPNYGMLDTVLGWFDIASRNWLGSPDTVLGATMVMAIWKEAGFLMVFYLAGLQNVSKDLLESARVDGASAWLTFRRIVFPLLMPTTLFVFIIATTGAFKLVDHIVIMTSGGPDNASNLLLFYIYETAFRFWDQGKAAVLTVVLLVILLVISCIQFFGLDKKIHYN